MVGRIATIASIIGTIVGKRKGVHDQDLETGLHQVIDDRQDRSVSFQIITVCINTIAELFS